MTQRDKAAALYCRVSTDAQYEEGYSIDAQKEMLSAYCVSRGINKYELYIDGGYSGSNIERPEMERLISDIKSGKISQVIVYKLDRLSRSQKDTLYLIEDVLIPHGVGFVSMNENMDTQTPIGRAMLGIMSAFAQLERETIKERTRMGMMERIKKGYWPGGGKIPFGYDYDPTLGTLVKNSDSQTVALMYELYLKGWSTLKIAKFFGLKYDKLAEQILKRKTNAGYIVYKGEEYLGRHEPIISLETYEQTLRMMKIRGRSGGGERKNLLSGLIYCGVCGAKMRYQKWGKGGYKIYCYSQDKGKPHLSRSEHCDNIKVDARELEKTVINDLFAMSGKVGERSEGDGGAMIKLLAEQEKKLRRKLKNLYELYSDREDEALLELINKTRKELDDNKKSADSLRESEKNREKMQEQIRSLQTTEEAWGLMTAEEKQNVMRSIIDKIVITYENTDIYYKILTEGQS